MNFLKKIMSNVVIYTTIVTLKYVVIGISFSMVEFFEIFRIYSQVDNLNHIY